MKKLASKHGDVAGDPTIKGVTVSDCTVKKQPGNLAIELLDGEVDDETLAGCVAAVSLLLSRRDNAHDRIDKHNQPAFWQRASLLEGTRSRPSINSHADLQRASRERSLWRSAGLPFLSAVLALFACAVLLVPAFATAVEEPQPENSGLKNPRLRIALSLPQGSEWTVEAVDGASIVDSVGNVVATLPAQSSWTATVGATAITFGGKNDAARLASAASKQKFRSVSFVPNAPNLPNMPNMPNINGIVNGASRVLRLPLMTDSGLLLVPTARGDDDNQVFGFNGKLYRGTLWLGNARTAARTSNGAVSAPPAPVARAINIVDVEDYLLSVVPSEMPASWPLEALKAQAVAARSYALSNLGKHASEGYDLKDTIEDQVYTGVAAENDATNEAVAATDGIVLKHNGRICTAFFHSASGGATEVADVVWGRSVPYLKAVPDYDDDSPHSSWTRRFPVEAVEKALRQDAPASDIGTLLAITPVRNSQSQRVQEVLLTGSAGTRITSGERMRRLFKLPSTIFNVGSEPDNYVIAGRGFGHGLGLSQWGAKSLAQQGYNAAQILAYYYKDVSVEYVTDTPGI